ncbi:hypothetical protein M0D21_00635 [Aquimarina sp. D1M17]|uniref:hypothetical protein n=1 Tax=Aquimarina acroporae TaxID=2937283 RepID=UPI0020C0E18E|nr:hypothetical protein [Aquimarina acroporae]MCK8520055.1 hypothetical protein [Aquimarina acroporae]
MKNILIFCIPLILYSTSCKEDNDGTDEMIDVDTTAEADIVSVSFSGDENAYTFSVGIKSPDKGCNQYADWWEIVAEDGTLIYRRILAHSHVNEQPFVRSGGPVAIKKDQIVYVRAHMNTSKYGSKVFKGSVENGFQESTLDKDFAIALEETEPLPSGCAF